MFRTRLPKPPEAHRTSGEYVRGVAAAVLDYGHPGEREPLRDPGLHLSGSMGNPLKVGILRPFERQLDATDVGRLPSYLLTAVLELPLQTRRHGIAKITLEAEMVHVPDQERFSGPSPSGVRSLTLQLTHPPAWPHRRGRKEVLAKIGGSGEAELGALSPDAVAALGLIHDATYKRLEELDGMAAASTSV